MMFFILKQTKDADILWISMKNIFQILMYIRKLDKKKEV